jgi:hypothetical protein
MIEHDLATGGGLGTDVRLPTRNPAQQIGEESEVQGVRYDEARDTIGSVDGFFDERGGDDFGMRVREMGTPWVGGLYEFREHSIEDTPAPDSTFGAGWTAQYDVDHG